MHVNQSNYPDPNFVYPMKDITNTIVGGNPAVEIRKRFVPGIVEFLLKLKWWD